MSRPWMPLYVADYLGDTRRLSTLAHGAYMLLIMEYWQHGGLPDDDAELSHITGLTIEEWLALKPSLARLFKPGWKHKRIDEELERAANIRSSASRGGQSKWSGESDGKTRAARLSAAREKGRHTVEQWNALVSACGSKCVRCGNDQSDIVKDHIMPIYRGGSDGIDNLQPLCIRCNSSKGPEAVDHRPNGWENAYEQALRRLPNACITPASTTTSSLRSEEREIAREVKPSSGRSSPMRPDAEPSDADAAVAKEYRLTGPPMIAEWKVFRAHQVSTGAKSFSWTESWRKWLHRKPQFERNQGGTNGKDRSVHAAVNGLIERGIDFGEAPEPYYLAVKREQRERHSQGENTVGLLPQG